MVHVGVGEKEVCIQQIPLIEHDLFTQQAYARTRIDNDTLPSTGNLKAGGIPPVLYSTWTGTGNTAPRPPKFEAKISGIRHWKLGIKYSEFGHFWQPPIFYDTVTQSHHNQSSCQDHPDRSSKFCRPPNRIVHWQPAHYQILR